MDVGDDLLAQYTDSIPKDDVSPEQYDRNLLVMLTLFLNDSSLFDLKSRLKACRFLITALRSTKTRMHLIPKVESICRYFAQFLPRLEVRIKEERAGAEEKLKNLVGIARYTDLNLWSVQDSSQRVHSQLCQIIHKFKIGSNKPAFSIIAEEFPPLPDVEFSVHPPVNNSTHSYGDIIEQVSSNTASLISATTLEDLIQLASGLRNLLNEDVNYGEVERVLKEQGTVDEDEIQEAKKKAYGAELFKRQRAFADLRKEASNYGINFRKGLLLDTEELNELSMTRAEEAVNENLKQLVPLSICARNVSLKLLAELNLHNKPHLKSQIPTESFAMIRGVIEFGLGVIVNTNNRLSYLNRLTSSMSTARTYIQRLLSNTATYDHRLLCERILAAFIDFASMKRELVTVRRYLNARPTLTTNDFHYPSLDHQSANDMCSRLEQLVQQTEYKLVDWIERKDGSHWVWSKEKLDQVHEFLLSEDLRQLSDLSRTFNALVPNCTHPLLRCQQNFAEHIRRIFDETTLEVRQSMAAFDADSVKLKIQSIYHAVEQDTNKQLKPLERLRQMLTSIKFSGLFEIDQQILSYVLNSAASNQLLQVVAAYADVLTVLVTNLVTFLERFAVFYLSFCSIIHHIIVKGVVNPIPVPDKTTEGEGKMVEGTGAGEGIGEKDVSDQIEETGQLEDLQGQEQHEEEGQPKDTETPIDMDDDFAADLEGIDGEENQDDEEGEEGQENQVDWDVGEVGQEEEKQLDPKLFDQQQQNIQPMDQEEQGANEETGELAAQSEEPKFENEVDEKEEELGSEKEEEDLEDEMENMDDIQLDDMEEMGPEPNVEESYPTEEEPESIEEDNIEERAEEDRSKTDQSGIDKEQPPNQQHQNSDNLEDKNEDISDDLGEQGEKQHETFLGDEHHGRANEEKIPDNKDDGAKSIASASRNQVDEVLPEALESDLVDRDEKDEDRVEDPNKVSHIFDDSKITDDREVIQDANVEQALNTKDRYQKHEDKKEKTEKMEFALRDRSISENILTGPIVKTSPTFNYDCGVSSVSSVSAPIRPIEDIDNEELEARWSRITEGIEVEAAELAEQLRILIEPTVASKLQGDYRTGKRLNIRRIIPYIASNYLKDRIWMQRKKADKRDYRVVLAVDNSGSMSDNRLSEITCSTVCLIEKAFDLLKIGQISVVAFGETVRLLQDFGDSGRNILGRLTFEDKKTDIVELLSAMDGHFAASGGTDKLLVVIGDGRMNTSSMNQIRSAIGKLLGSSVLILYVILDQPNSSVTAMKVFQNNKLSDYMAVFPFGFYAIVQNISDIPVAVSEAIRQFFELSA